MNIYLFKVPRECYPRYSYTCKYAKPWLKRFKTVLNALQINADVAEPSFGDIQVFYLCENSGNLPGVKDICFRHDDKIEERLLTEKEFETSFGSSTWNDTDIFLAPCEYTKTAEKFMGPRRLFVQRERKDSQSSIAVDNATTVQELALNISVLLERVIIDKLLERIGVLAYFMKLKDETKEISQSELRVDKSNGSSPTKRLKRSMSLDSVSQFSMENFKELIAELLKRVPKSFRKEVAKFTMAKKEQADFSEKQMLRDVARQQSAPSTGRGDSDLTQLIQKLKRLEEQDEAIEQLYGEMQGMVYRLKISEMPQDAIDMNPDLDEEVAKTILSVDGVISVGYRFRTLDIFLDDNISQELRENAEKSLQLILCKHGIYRYAFHCTQKELAQFRQVGARLTLDSTGGALGGFAKRNDDMCVLLANHVAQVSPRVYIQSPEGSTLFAKVLPPQIPMTRSDIDIAIAQVVKNEQINCDVRFKSEDGTGLPTTLCTFKNIQWLCNLPVHIWRANSNPGLGIISHPVIYRKGASTKLVQIEDRPSEEGNEMQRFAVRGDSGAIVCANDPDDNAVHVIAMFIGSLNSSVAAQDPRIRQQYIAFRLVDGLNQLQHEQNASVTLYQAKQANDLS